MRPRIDLVNNLLNMLSEGGPMAFDVFVGALRVTGQLILANELEKQEKAERMEKVTLGYTGTVSNSTIFV